MRKEYSALGAIQRRAKVVAMSEGIEIFFDVSSGAVDFVASSCAIDVESAYNLMFKYITNSESFLNNVNKKFSGYH